MNAQEYLDLARKEERNDATIQTNTILQLHICMAQVLSTRFPRKELTEQFQEIELQVNAAREVEYVLQLEQLYDNRWKTYMTTIFWTLRLTSTRSSASRK